MNWIDFIIVFIVVALVGLIIFFNIKNLKNNSGCSKCPYSKNCEKKYCKKDIKKNTNNINKEAN